MHVLTVIYKGMLKDEQSYSIYNVVHGAHVCQREEIADFREVDILHGKVITITAGLRI